MICRLVVWEIVGAYCGAGFGFVLLMISRLCWVMFGFGLC